MKRCSECTQLEDGTCAKYRKPPPNDEFAAKCRYFEQGDGSPYAPPGCTCSDCERYDRDELSEWCLFHSAADCITFKPLPLPKGESCPLT